MGEVGKQVTKKKSAGLRGRPGAGLLAGGARALLDLLFPAHCVVCDAVLPLFSAPGVCHRCEGKLRYVEEPFCMQCGRSVASEHMACCFSCEQQRKKSTGREEAFPFLYNRALLQYTDEAAASLARFKYGGRREYASFYMEQWFQTYGAELMRAPIDTMIPVPIHEQRRRKRGYNQAEVLAGQLSRHVPAELRFDLLARTRKTVAQKELSAGERRINLRQAFAVTGDVTGRHILLVDDIYTTGSTMTACSRRLLEAGAASVRGAVVAIGASDAPSA